MNEKTEVSIQEKAELLGTEEFDQNNPVELMTIDRPPSNTMAVGQGPVHPGALIAIAMNRSDIDIGKLEQLFELQKAYEDNEARKDFHKSMVVFRENLPTIVNKDEVSFNTTQYKYAGLSSTLGQIKIALVSSEINPSWEIDDLTVPGQIRVTCFVTHAKGYQKETSFSAPPDASGGKNAIQAKKSTVSYLERITLYALLGLASQDDDDDGRAGGGPEVSEQVAQNFEQSEFYPQEKFDKNFPTWSKKIESGAKTAKQMVEWLNKGKPPLSENQVNLLMGVEVKL